LPPILRLTDPGYVTLATSSTKSCFSHFLLVASILLVCLSLWMVLLLIWKCDRTKFRLEYSINLINYFECNGLVKVWCFVTADQTSFQKNVTWLMKWMKMQQESCCWTARAADGIRVSSQYYRQAWQKYATGRPN